MLVASITSNKPAPSGNRTYEDWYNYLGDHSEMMGVLSKQYPENTMSFITEAIGNIFKTDQAANKFQPVNSFSIEWQLEVDYVKKVPFAALPNGNGVSGSSILMYFPERYYEFCDTFVIEGSRQICVVLAAPIQRGADMWEYQVQLLDADFTETLDLTSCGIGMMTHWMYCIMPEASEVGYTKYQSNFEKHRVWMTEHRSDQEFTSRYKANEDKFVYLNNTDTKKTENIFKYPGAEQTAFESLQMAKNNNLLWGKTTMDKNGNCTVHLPDGRPLMAGDGAIPQIERYCDQSVYATHNLTLNTLNTMLNTMSTKARNLTGNTYVFIINAILWNDLQHIMEMYARDWKMVPAAIFSQKVDGMVALGATYNAYEHAGNKIIFKADTSLSKEYPNKGYGVCLDTTPDIQDKQPNIFQFAYKGKEFIKSTVLGHGGMSGLDSGVVSQSIAASKIIVSCMSGIAVVAPYRAYILTEA